MQPNPTVNNVRMSGLILACFRMYLGPGLFCERETFLEATIANRVVRFSWRGHGTNRRLGKVVFGG